MPETAGKRSSGRISCCLLPDAVFNDAVHTFEPVHATKNSPGCCKLSLSANIASR